MACPNDHRPAHVHVLGSGLEAVFKLNCPEGPLELRENYGFSHPQVNRIQADLAKQLAHFCAKWERSMAVREDEFEAANARGAARLAKAATAVSARYDRRIGRLVIELSTGLAVSFKPQDAQGLEHAKPGDMAAIEISPSGLGLHVPALDADLYLPALLDGFLGSRAWMAASMGKAGGQSASQAKAAAARANGKLGGRPKKVRDVAQA